MVLQFVKHKLLKHLDLTKPETLDDVALRATLITELKKQEESCNNNRDSERLLIKQQSEERTLSEQYEQRNSSSFFLLDLEDGVVLE
jgi:hypothetical protein